MKKATRQHTRALNSQLILNTIYGHGQVSRAEVARLTGLTRTTVSDVVAGLMGDGLVREVGVGPSVGGKPPILLSVEENSRCLIGLDLANSEFRGALINLRGEIGQRAKLPVQDQDGDAALTLVYRLVETLAGAAQSPIMGIGIGAPGLMDPAAGIIRYAVNLDWRDLPLGDLLEERFGLPTYIANDSQAAAMAEYSFGCSGDLKNLVLIRAGRGIGAGIVLNGQLYYGDSFGAGEIGHVVVVEGGEQCRCGHYGCLETVASSRALIREARAIAAADPDSIYHRLARSVEAIDSETLWLAFEQGDPATHALAEKAGFYLGIAISHLIGVLNVNHVAIAGSLARFGEALLDPIRRQIEQRSLSALAARTTIAVSKLGNDIVTLGAAALLLSNELGLA
jgi:glucokinase-like ROK family protein